MSIFSLKLSKDEFKFSSAHFLIFNDHQAERLHGHNYQVEFEVLF
nr:6-carboxytetrahydropterin synthase [Pseudobdellovibrionaceae bacterium]